MHYIIVSYNVRIILLYHTLAHQRGFKGAMKSALRAQQMQWIAERFDATNDGSRMGSCFDPAWIMLMATAGHPYCCSVV